MLFISDNIYRLLGHKRVLQGTNETGKRTLSKDLFLELLGLIQEYVIYKRQQAQGITLVLQVTTGTEKITLSTDFFISNFWD